jgi:hypothetical protein
MDKKYHAGFLIGKSLIHWEFNCRDAQCASANQRKINAP